jgi:arylsulfatase A-like enzyme
MYKISLSRWPVAIVTCFILSIAHVTSAATRVTKPNLIIILTDDHGYADLSCQGQESDVKTPNLDRLAAEGVRFTDGYVSAPQCCPSRAGLLTGRDQNRFGFICNGYGPLPLSEKTIADRLGGAGYATGMVGKWHLDPNHSDNNFLEKQGIKDGKIPPAIQKLYHPRARGFQETFCGQLNSYSATFDLQGKRFEKLTEVKTKGDRLDVQSDAALRFIDFHHQKPFFLYLAYFGPHVPLASSKKYLDRFPGPMPERRRYALAMLAAIDDGVGNIMKKLEQHGIDDNTLIFFIGDNGAPLKLTMPDTPIGAPGAEWDGSKNTPLNGEKGMLSEGGIRVPFLARWKGTIPGGQICRTPVSTLDVAATACAISGLGRPETLDGHDLLPMLAHGKPLAERTLCWRFWEQTAVREGDWKLLTYRKSFLFNLAKDREEKLDQSAKHPEIVARLTQKATEWSAGLTPPGIPVGTGKSQESGFYHHFFGLALSPGLAATDNPFDAKTHTKN